MGSRAVKGAGKTPGFYRAAFACYLAVSLAIAGVGLFYLLRDELMPYHLEALGTRWSELGPEYQLLFKSLLNGAGGAALGAGTAMLLILSFPFRRGELWAAWALLLVGVAVAAPTTLIVLRIRETTAANPPLFPLILGDALLVAGLVFSQLGGVQRR